MKKIMSVFGCRPDAIKMAPLIREIRASAKLESIVCATGQHREMLDQALELFEIKPDYDLDVMKPNQTLFDITQNIMSRIQPVLEKEKPDLVLVHGDSTTAFAAAVSAFYLRIPIGHVEAGLRTGRIYSPYPEECNRQMVGTMATYHFAPTQKAASNLASEGLPKESVFITGNTVIDALLWITSRQTRYPHLEKHYAGKPMVLMTVHRRENHGAPALEIFRAVRDFARKKPSIQVLYPVHPNQKIRQLALEQLGGITNVSLIDPLSYDELAFALKNCQFVITDSGGLQEEAPTFGKPLLVLRDTTERPEAIEAGCAALVGTSHDLVLEQMLKLADLRSREYLSMSRAANPFGDGTASKQIVSAIENSIVPLPARYL